MKFLLALFAIVIAVLVQQITATSEPFCSYRNSQDDTVLLKYFPFSKRGEEYVDFGTDGKCVKRATCTDTFRTVVEDCNKFPVTCNNKQNYQGVFPACCVKC